MAFFKLMCYNEMVKICSFYNIQKRKRRYYAKNQDQEACLQAGKITCRKGGCKERKFNV